LKKKGYDIIYEDFVVMAANVFMRYKDSLVKQLYETAKTRSKKIVDNIFSGKKKWEQPNPLLTITSWLFSF